MNFKNNRSALLCYVKCCESFRSHQWIQTGVTFQKCGIRVKIVDFFVRCYLEIYWMNLKTNKAPLLRYHLIVINEIKEGFYSSETLNFGENRYFYVACDIETSTGDLTKQMAPLLCHFKFCASFDSQELQSGDAQFGYKLAIFCPGWPWILTSDLENNRAPLRCYIKLCAPFHSRMWIQTGFTVLTPVTSPFDPWPWPFAWA